MEEKILKLIQEFFSLPTVYHISPVVRRIVESYVNQSGIHADSWRVSMDICDTFGVNAPSQKVLFHRQLKHLNK